MASIVIRDLPENVDLDRKAMQAIAGGARFRSQAGAQPSRGPRIVNFRIPPARKPPPTTFP